LTARVPISILIPTLDEELNLPGALASCAFADQVVVLDSFSKDRTEEIARAAGAEFVQHRFENYSAQKNWALDTVAWRNRWIFILDADERFTPDLAREVTEEIAKPSAKEGYYVNRRLMFMGRWIRHCGWYPNWNLRLFQLGRARYDGRPVHEHMKIEGSVAYLRADLLHDDQRGLEHYLEKHNRYSTLDAQTRLSLKPDPFRWDHLRHPTLFKRFLRQRVWPYVPAKPLAAFVYLYFLRLGFLDGRAGLSFSLLQAQQELHVVLKLRELRAGQTPGAR
jgi:glycosyltransferase involved in cell wall biosynthesis